MLKISRAETLQQSMCEDVAWDGQIAQLFVLKNKQGMQVTLMDVGATWLSCELLIEGEFRDVLLGVDTMATHRTQEAYFGATIGRYANRIKKGQFIIVSQQYQLSQNQGGNTLHGGALGFDKLRWQAKRISEQNVIFTLISKDGDQGFPGTLEAQVSYYLSADNALSIEYQARVDKACPVNLTNHAYFNLNGSAKNQNCLTHKMKINADQYVPVDTSGIPLGAFENVEDSSFDFRNFKNIGADFLCDAEQKKVAGYDHSFIVNGAQSKLKENVVEVISTDEKVKLCVSTTQPSVHLYTGNYLAGIVNRVGGEYQNQAGFALEAQFLADAPNHPEWSFTDSILHPDELYQQQTIFSFHF